MPTHQQVTSSLAGPDSAGANDGQGRKAWEQLCAEAAFAADHDPVLLPAMSASVLSHGSFDEALAQRIALKLGDQDLGRDALLPIIRESLAGDPALPTAAMADLAAVRDRDASISDLLTPFLHFKGFLALQGQRVSHRLWRHGRRHLARHLQSRISEVLGVDIHPAARIGRGVMLDHGSGIVVGETAVIEDDVSILQGVTLGGTGKENGDRHPKVRRGVLIGAGAKVLGNIEVGVGAKIGAGSVVVADVQPFTTVVGVPARPVGRPHTSLAGVTMNQTLPEYDFVI